MTEAGKTAPQQNEADKQILEHSHRHTRRSFAVAAGAAAAGYGVYYWIDNTREIGRQELPLRRAFQANASISRTIFDERGLAPTYPVGQSSPLRLNGNIGMMQDLVPDSYRLQLVGTANPAQSPRFTKDVTAWQYLYSGKGKDASDTDVKAPPAPKSASTPCGKSGGQPAVQSPIPKAGSDSQAVTPPLTKNGEALSIAQRFDAMNHAITHKRIRGDAEAGPSASGLEDGTPGLLLTIEDIRKLPHHELVTEFKCIEGWSQVVHWAGVRLVDLLDAYPPAKIGGPNGRDPRFVYMETPDGNYYGGYDLSACRHPQSLLVTEMAGEPLTPEHGAPLRLHMPIKYGYKQLKRIGLIAYMDTRPDDYWTKLGYDWYAGL